MLSCSSALFQRIAFKFMAPKLKPQRLHQIAETGTEQLVKKARTMSTESSMKDAFSTLLTLIISITLMRSEKEW
ncbi:hypothetical protein V5N11_032770 [Cardamine amara subsp. amara]|uniref:Uncharacterized protein n=1 Tax=Cardamine amara subsp. amara TaxID=228776 RepID=A0ABD1AK62_CARAN